MRARRRLALVLAGACLLAAAAAGVARAAALAPFEARYRLSLGGLTVGEMRLALRAAGDGRYLYEMASRPRGLLALFRRDTLTERSLWERGPDGAPRPLRYERIQTGSRERRARLVFAWSPDGSGRVRNEVAGRPWAMAVPPGTLDRLLVQLALRRDLAAGRKPLEYPIADGGKLKRYRFAVLGRETVTTSAGRFETVKIQRLRRKGKPPLYFWLAPGLDYLLVAGTRPGGEGGTVRMELVEIRPASGLGRQALAEGANGLRPTADR